MAINGLAGMKDYLADFDVSQKNKVCANTGTSKEPDIDKEENDKLASKMYLAGTTADAAAAYFGALQDAVKDSKNGFEANRRVNRLTETHKSILSSEEYANKPEAKSIVKDFTEAMDEKKKEADEVLEKRMEKEESETGKTSSYDDIHRRISSIKPSMSQIAEDMKRSNKKFLDFWIENGNGGHVPGHVISADGSFKIFNSTAEKDEYMKNQKTDFLKDVISVIKSGKNSSVDIKV